MFGWNRSSAENCAFINAINSPKLEGWCGSDSHLRFIVTLGTNFTTIPLKTSTIHFDSPRSFKTPDDKPYLRVIHVYRQSISGFSAELSRTALLELLDSSLVTRVEQDLKVNMLTLQRNPIWNLDRIDQSSNRLDDLYDTGSLDGRGANIYVLDTGINAHAEFGSRLRGGRNFVDDGRGWGDCNGHGTHCAGTAAGRTFGVAKQASLYAGRVLDCSGTGAWSQILAGLEWVIDEAGTKKGVIASLSLGGPQSRSIDQAVNNAVDRGVFVVVAAGNENSDACTSSPARSSKAVTVGASTVNDRRSSFSNYGSCVDIFAPGSNIRSASFKSNTGSSVLSGTSMACPHVAGAAALEMQKNDFLRSPLQVFVAIKRIATPNSISDSRSSAPLLRTASDGGAPPPLDPGCKTVSGPRPGRGCRFPFQFQGTVYRECTDVTDTPGRYWCSVEVDENGRHVSGQWGYCSPDCPRPRPPLMRPTMRPTRRPTNGPTFTNDPCITIGGPARGERCVFPFIYKRVAYNSCTTEDDPENRRWCSVQVDSSGRHVQGNWGYCPSTCSVPSVPPTGAPSREPNPRPRPTPSPTSSATAFPTSQPRPTPPATSPPSLFPDPGPPGPEPPGACEILGRINELRAKANLPGLRIDNRLQDAATKHALDMANRGYFDHESPDGDNVDDRVIREGYEWTVVAENIAAGYNDCDGLIEGWKTSPGHYKNIMCSSCEDTGLIGVFQPGTKWRYYYVQVFGTTKQKHDPPVFSCPPLPPPQNIVACTTIGGPDSDAKCKFPFTYEDTTYTTCIQQESIKWCSTETDEFGRHKPGIGKWGYCAASCPAKSAACSGWWCPKQSQTAIGSPYGPVRIKIPQLKMTGVPMDSVAEIEGTLTKERTRKVYWWVWLIICLAVVAFVTACVCYKRQMNKPAPNTPTISAQL